MQLLTSCTKFVSLHGIAELYFCCFILAGINLFRLALELSGTIFLAAFF